MDQGNRAFDAREFWDKRILGWEEGHYGELQFGAPGLERLANRASGSLRFRLDAAREILEVHVPGKRVLEVGCGSVLLAECLVKAGADMYTVIDLAPSAIENARACRRDWFDAERTLRNR